MSLTYLQRRFQNSSLRTERTAADNLPSSTLPRLLGSRRLSQAAVLTNVINNASSYSRVQGSQFRLQYAAPLDCPIVLPQCSLAAPPCSLAAPSKAALFPFPNRNRIPNPKFGVYIYIYIYKFREQAKTSKNAHVEGRLKERFTDSGPPTYLRIHAPNPNLHPSPSISFPAPNPTRG